MKASRSIITGMAAVLSMLWLSSCTTMEPKRDNVLEEYTSRGFSIQNGAVDLSMPWWTCFDSAQLNRLMTEAFSGSLTLEQAAARLQQAEASARKSGASGSVQMEGKADTSTSYLSGENEGTQSARSVGLYASYEVDLWGRISSTKKAALANWKMSEYDMQTAAMTLSAELATTYFNWMSQHELLVIYESQLASNEKKLESLERRFETGQATALDVLQQRQLVAAAEAKLPLVHRSIQSYKNSLATLLGKPVDADLHLVVEALPNLPAKPVVGLPAELLGRRPDIQSARLALESADWYVSAARAARLPTLSLTGSISTESSHVDELFNDWISNLAAGLLAPLLDGGSRSAEVDRTLAVARESIASYRQTVLEAVQETEDALYGEQQQQAYVSALDEQYLAATRTENESITRYQFGVLPYLDTVSAIVSRQSLEITTLQAKTDLLTNRIQLYRALGGDWTFILEKEI